MARTPYTSPDQATYVGPHRRTYPPEWILADDQTWWLLQLCEDYARDQWEPTVLHLWRASSRAVA